jgi:shikimate kinase
VSIWLDVPLVELIPRIPLDGRRPLAADRAQLDRLYASRIEAYRFAHLRIDAARAPVPLIVDRVLDALRQPPFLNPQGLDRRQ